MSPIASDPMIGEQHDDIAVGVRASEVIDLDPFAAEVEPKAISRA